MKRREFLATIGAAIALPLLPLTYCPDSKQRTREYILELADLYKTVIQYRAEMLEETRNLGLSPKGRRLLDDIMQAIVEEYGGAK